MSRQIPLRQKAIALYLSPEAAQDLYDRYRHLYTVLDHLMESALAEKTQPIADTPDDLPATA